MNRFPQFSDNSSN